MAIGRPVSLTSNVASKSVRATATAGQTLFTVSGGYRVNQIAVFRNGSRLVDGEDYTARDGSSVTLITPANLNDTLEFQIFDDFRVADAILNSASNQVISGDLTVTGTLTGSTVGIQSGGAVIGTAKTLNFIGTGNTFAVSGDTVDISIAGGGGGGLGTAIDYANGTATPFSYIDRETNVTADLLLDTSTAGTSDSYIVSVVPNITVNSGVAITVGAGKSMIIDVLQIGDL